MMRFSSVAALKKALKKSGKEHLEFKNYMEAIEQFTKILQYDPNDFKVYANRSLAYLKHGLFNLALKDAEQALEINPHFEKGIIRKIQSLWGLNKYKEALEYLKSSEIPKALLDLPNFKELHEKAVKFVKQSNGEYDMIEISKLQQGQCHDLAEFKGPLKIEEIPGKGRGLVATRDIQPGQLLLVSKAFAIAFGFEDKVGVDFDQDKVDILLQTCCEKLSLEPELRQEFSKLYSGNETQNPDWIWINADEDEELEQEMIKEVRNRIFYTSFAGDGNPNYCGIWLLPSYFNHNCIDANVHWIFYGDFMICRAFKEIKKGQELTINYFVPNDPNRFELMRTQFKFICDCRLCQFELNEKSEIKQEIDLTLKSLKKELSRPKVDLGNALTRVNLLVSLRGEENISLNMELLDFSLDQVALQLYGKMRFEEGLDVLKVFRNASFNAVCISQVVQKDMTIGLIYMKMGMHLEVKKWIKILKQDLIILYGTTEMIKEIGQCFIKNLTAFDPTIEFFEV